MFEGLENWVDIPSCLREPHMYEYVCDTVSKLQDWENGSSFLQLSLRLAVDKDRTLNEQGLVNMKPPQLSFDPPIDNSCKEPFVPRISPARLSRLTPQVREWAVQEEEVTTSPLVYPHPFEKELAELEYQPWQLREGSKSTEVPIAPLWRGGARLIRNQEELRGAIEELRLENIVAVGVKQHLHLSFQGLSCLLLVS